MGNINGATERPSCDHVPVGLYGDSRKIINKSIRVHPLAALEPIAVSMEILRSALGDNLNLSATRSAEFGALRIGSDVELGNGIDVDAVRELLVYADIGYILAVHSIVVGHSGQAVKTHVRGAACIIRRDARDGSQQARVIAPLN